MIAHAEHMIGEKRRATPRKTHPLATLALGRTSIRAGRKYGDPGLVRLGQKQVEHAIAELNSDEYLAREMKNMGDEALRYARAHRQFLQENRPDVLANLSKDGKLASYLSAVGSQAAEMYDNLLMRKNHAAEVQALPYMEKVARLRTHEHEANEVVLHDIVCQPQRADRPTRRRESPKSLGQEAASSATWRLVGWDAFADEDYPLPGEYGSEIAAQEAARKRLEHLERIQPCAKSGGQAPGGIQDRVLIVRPNGTSYRYLPSDWPLDAPSEGDG
jgi:hypothetical protein